MSEVYDPTPCTLGEGPLWHPDRRQLFWFDVTEGRLLTREHGETRVFQFDECVSAAGWVNGSDLLIASETRLFRFDVEREVAEDVIPLEPDNPATRSNDGRADPWGGFWIGTMGKHAEPGQGAIYRYYQGRLTLLFGGMTIPNAICFAPDGRSAYYTDTPTRMIMRQPLSAQDGWPAEAPQVFVDLTDEGLNPDGSVVDADGTLWNAQWGAWRVAGYAPDGTFLRAISFGAAHTSCPAFGGDEMRTMFCTTAREGLSEQDRTRSSHNGMTFAAKHVARGQAEHRVQL